MDIIYGYFQLAKVHCDARVTDGTHPTNSWRFRFLRNPLLLLRSLAAFVANYGAFPFPSSSFLVASFVAVDGGDGGIWIDEFSPAHPTSGVDLREESDVRDTAQKLAEYLL